MNLLLNPYAIKVAASFSPADVAGLTLWLKADAITGKVDNDIITNWDDSSAANNDAVQGTGSREPIYKTNIVNGKPVLRFDGTNDFLSTPSLTSRTGFVVCNHADGATFSTYRRVIHPETGFQWYGDSGTGNYANSGMTTFRVNGVATVSAGTLSAFRVVMWEASSPTTDVHGIGAIASIVGQLLLGDIAEVIFYSGTITSGERDSVEAYLTAKYAL